MVYVYATINNLEKQKKLKKQAKFYSKSFYKLSKRMKKKKNKNIANYK